MRDGTKSLQHPDLGLPDEPIFGYEGEVGAPKFRLRVIEAMRAGFLLPKCWQESSNGLYFNWRFTLKVNSLKELYLEELEVKVLQGQIRARGLRYTRHKPVVGAGLLGLDGKNKR